MLQAYRRRSLRHVALALVSALWLIATPGCESDFMQGGLPASGGQTDVSDAGTGQGEESVGVRVPVTDPAARTFTPCPLSGCGPFAMDIVEPDSAEYAREALAWRYDAMAVSTPDARFCNPRPVLSCSVSGYKVEGDTVRLELGVVVRDPIADITPNTLGTVKQGGAGIESVFAQIRPNASHPRPGLLDNPAGMTSVGGAVTVPLNANADQQSGFWRPHPYVGTLKNALVLEAHVGGTKNLLGGLGSGRKVGEGMHLVTVHTTPNAAGLRGLAWTTMNLYRDRKGDLHVEVEPFRSGTSETVKPLTMRFTDARTQSRLAAVVGNMFFAAGSLHEDGNRYIGDQQGRATLFFNTFNQSNGRAALIGYSPRLRKFFRCPYDPDMGGGRIGLNVQYGTY